MWSPNRRRDEEVFQEEDRLMEEQHGHRQISMETTSSRGSSSAETGFVKPMSTRAYQAKQSSSSTGTKPRKSQVTTKTAASSRGSSSAETGVVKSMTTRAYQSKQSPSSSTGTKPRKSQVTTKTAGKRGRVRGPIKEPDRTILREKTPALINSLKDPKLLITSLRARGVFDDHDKERVEGEIRNNGNKNDKDESGDNDIDGEQTRHNIFPERLERLEKENEELREEKEQMEKKLQNLKKSDKEKEDMKRDNERLAKENEQLKANKLREEVKNTTSTSYDVQRIPRGYFHDSRTVGISSQALIKESSRSEVTDYDYIQLKSYVFTTKDSKIKKPQRGRGKMPDKEYDIIQSNFNMLLDSIQPDVLCQALFEKEVFDEDDLEQIKIEKSKGRKSVTEKLLLLLLRCGPEAFGKFMTCLHQTGHDGILKQLQSALEALEEEEERKPDKGPTKVVDKTLLRTNMPKLLQILTDPDVILNSLLARGVFSVSDIEMIKKEIQEHDKQAGIMKLFTTLQQCGPDAFQLFGECLKEQGYAEAMELLQLNDESVEDSKYPLHEAASIVDNIHDFTDILDRYRDQINSLNSEGETVFTCAMLSTSIPADKLKLLLDQEADRKLIKEKITRENMLQICKSSSISVLKFLIDTKLITISKFIPDVLFRVCESDKDPVGKLEVLLSNGGDLHVNS